MTHSNASGRDVPQSGPVPLETARIRAKGMSENGAASGAPPGAIRADRRLAAAGGGLRAEAVALTAEVAPEKAYALSVNLSGWCDAPVEDVKAWMMEIRRLGEPASAEAAGSVEGNIGEVSGPGVSDSRPSPAAGWDAPLEAADVWRDGGWEVFPLPRNEKSPPPPGRTGRNGKGMSAAEMRSYVAGRASGGDPGWTISDEINIGVRIPRNCVAIDRDDHKGPAAARTLGKCPGPLSPTWRITGRDPTADASGIYLYRKPSEWADAEYPEGGPGVEILQSHHRYAVAPPSVVADAAAARAYALYAPDGAPETEPPRPEDLPELPGSPDDWAEAMGDKKRLRKKGPGPDFRDPLYGGRSRPPWRPGEAIERVGDDAPARHDRLRNWTYWAVEFAADRKDLDEYVRMMCEDVKEGAEERGRREWFREADPGGAVKRFEGNGGKPFSRHFTDWKTAPREDPRWGGGYPGDGYADSPAPEVFLEVRWMDPATGEYLEEGDPVFPEWWRSGRRGAVARRTQWAAALLPMLVRASAYIPPGYYLGNRGYSPVSLWGITVAPPGGGKSTGQSTGRSLLPAAPAFLLRDGAVPPSASGVISLFTRAVKGPGKSGLRKVPVLGTERDILPPPPAPPPPTGGHYAAGGATQVIVTSAPVAGTASSPGNGMATAGLTLAVIAMALAWIPFINFVFGAPCWVLGIVFSAVGMGKSKRFPDRKGRGVAIAGLCVSLGGVALFILGIIALSAAL